MKSGNILPEEYVWLMITLTLIENVDILPGSNKETKFTYPRTSKYGLASLQSVENYKT